MLDFPSCWTFQVAYAAKKTYLFWPHIRSICFILLNFREKTQPLDHPKSRSINLGEISQSRLFEKTTRWQLWLSYQQRCDCQCYPILPLLNSRILPPEFVVAYQGTLELFFFFFGPWTLDNWGCFQARWSPTMYTKYTSLRSKSQIPCPKSLHS